MEATRGGARPSGGVGELREARGRLCGRNDVRLKTTSRQNFGLFQAREMLV